ncbi:MAG TPA: hypothetical protein VGK23_02310 [Methanomassiliicoccales archaeon]|jgi:hypothetical protein
MPRRMIQKWISDRIIWKSNDLMRLEKDVKDPENAAYAQNMHLYIVQERAEIRELQIVLKQMKVGGMFDVIVEFLGRFRS